MKKIAITLVALLATSFAFAQEEKKEEAPKGPWTRQGNASILLNQAAFNSKWATGGLNSLSLDFNVSYDVNYAKEDWTWDNKFIGAYGLAKIDNQDAQKTNDRLELNSLVGKKASGYWSYSFVANLRTQFADGFDGAPRVLNVVDPVTNAVSTVEVPDEGNKNSKFFSPAYLQFGPGMLWKKSDNFKFNIAPATSRFVFVDSEFTDFGSAFGVDQGDTSRYELGAFLQGYYKTTIIKNISLENILSLYSNYLEDPQNIDIDYTMNLVMKVNKYISANLTFQALYDDNTVNNFQIRETFGVGMNYGF